MLTRCGLGSPYAAPQTASASADMRVLMNVVSIERSKSGDAEAAGRAGNGQGRYCWERSSRESLSEAL